MKKEKQVLIQTLLPEDLAAWVRVKAAKEGLSVAAWVRSLLMRRRTLERLPRP